MAKTLLIFSIFTLFLFTVATAVIAYDPVTVTDSTNSDEKITDLPLSESDEKTQTFFVKSIDQPPRFIFSRPHPIKREFYGTTSRIPLRFVKRRPCRKFLKSVMIPRSYGNDAIVDGETFNFDTETIGNDQVSNKWKHSYGHGKHHDKDEEHKEKKRGHKGGFVRRIRKFLKHTFD